MNQIDENNDSERQVERPSTAQGASQTRRRFVSGSLSAAPVLLALQSSSALAGTCRTPSRMMSGNLSNHGDKSTCMAGRSPGYWVQPQKFSEWRVDKPTLQERKLNPSPSWRDINTGSPSLEKFAYTSLPPAAGDCRVKPTDDANPVSIDFGAMFEDIFVHRRSMNNVLPSPVKASELGTKTPVADSFRKISFWEILAYPTQLGVDAVTAQLARHCIAAYLNALMAEATGQFYPITSQQAIYMWQDGSVGGYCAITTCSAPWSAAQIIDYIQSTFDGQFPD
jgi:hypothetical protein